MPNLKYPICFLTEQEKEKIRNACEEGTDVEVAYSFFNDVKWKPDWFKHILEDKSIFNIDLETGEFNLRAKELTEARE